MKRARLCHTGNGEALTEVVNQRSSLDNIEIGVLDEFIELQKPIVPENVKTAAASLATRSSPAHMGPAAREDAEVVTAWIKSHG